MNASTPVQLNEDERRKLAVRVACALALPQAPSPCINVCQIDAASGYCRGCWRTLDEIAHWAAFDENAKRAIWQQLPLRSQPV